MKLIVNGDERNVGEGLTLAQILDEFGLSPSYGIAVAVNDTVVSRGRLQEYRPADGDAIEIINAVAGG
ncbi:MAG TPA: sulfur carrier protein ThiS [Candidatus Baltobacteraceae bacterium]|jgi:sulfur carrier protein